MGNKKLCIVCGARPPEVPDRERMGRPIKRVCLECHRARLAGDARPIIAAANLARLSAAVVEAAVLRSQMCLCTCEHCKRADVATDALIAARKEQEASRG